MTIKNFVNRKTGIEPDTMDAATLGSLEFRETDTGNVYFKEGVDLVLKEGPEKPETLVNKELDMETSDIPNRILDYPFSSNYLKKGWLIPAATPQGSLNGIIDGSTLHNPYSILPTDTDGYLVNFRSKVASDKLGFSSPVPICRRADNYTLKCQVRNAKVSSVLVGFASSAAFSGYSNVFFNNDVGACIGFTPSQTKWCAFYNNGGGTPATPDPFTPDKDELLHTIEIILSSANIIFKLDNESKTVTSPIPSTTTDLYLHVYGVY